MSIAIARLLRDPAATDAKLLTPGREAGFTAIAAAAGTVAMVCERLDSAALDAVPVIDSDTPPRNVLLALLDAQSDLGWRLDALFARAAARGVSVIALAPASPVSAAALEVAAGHGVAVIQCSDPWRLSVAAHQLLGGRVAALGRTISSLTRALRSSGMTVEGAIRALEQPIGAEVRLVDGSGNVLQGAPLSRPDQEGVARALRRQIPQTLSLAGGAIAMAAPVDTGFLAKPWLVAIASELSTEEIAASVAGLEVASIAIGHRLALRRIEDEREARDRTALLREMLDAADDLPVVLVHRILAAGWILEGYHVGVRIVVPGHVDVVSQRLEVEHAFAKQGVTLAMVEQADGWAAWTTLEVEPTASETTQLGARIRRAQQALGRFAETHVGVGRVHAGRSGIVKTLSEATDAARLAARRPQTGHFVHIDQLNLAQLLLAWTRTDTFQPAAAELLKPIQRGGSELLDTLGAYLDAESSVVEAAAVLGVHRNTVSYRIDTIQRLLGINLSDPETRLALHLAIRTMNPREERS